VKSLDREKLVLKWESPQDNGGADLKYTVLREHDDTTHETSDITTTESSIKGLVLG
jgi:hypothetical protein